MDKSDIATRMKMYEKLAQQRFIPMLPICIRLDGRSFSKWTKDLASPYDTGMMNLMRDLTIELVKETNAIIGYTQSDEISLILYSEDIKSQVYFDGKIQKVISSLSAFASAWFSTKFPEYLDTPSDSLATFDCRAWQVPNKIEAVNSLLWREQDASKNSLSMAARDSYTHKELMNKSGSDMQDMMMEKGINWNDFPQQFKRGVFLQKQKVPRDFTEEERVVLQEKGVVIDTLVKISRTKIVVIDMPPFSKVLNRTEVLFDRQKPLVATWDKA